MSTAKNRAEALVSGDIHYLPEKPCPKGHMTKRRTANHKCVECSRISTKGSPAYKFRKNKGVKRVFDKIRAEILEALSGSKCACCGEDKLVFLCIDHIKGGGTAHRKVVKPGQRLYYWLRSQIKEFGLAKVQEEFRVLCYNCNAAYWILGHCPHHPPEQD